ncbi:MAG TPA: DUF2339 domain-containing protein [Gaiellaceae bacterium]|nr:DUF2339 domain-containing protein [Gaiellaceae bacterium]
MPEHAERRSTDEEKTNLGFALALHFGIGFFWLFFVSVVAGGLAMLAAGAAGGKVVGVLWGLSATVLWIVAAVRMVRARREAGRVWRLSLGWWGRSFVAPYFLFREVRDRTRAAGPALAIETRPAEVEMNADELTTVNRRLDKLALQLKTLEREVAELRRAGTQPAPSAPTVTPPAATPTPWPRPERPPIPARPAPPPRAPEPSWWSGLTMADLYSAKVLAWLGGAVMLLGILFFFVLAVNRGWIGPVARVSLGALASALVFSAGLFLRRRFGPVYSAYAAVGVGIAGGYVTLLAAKLRYDLVSDWTALLIAAGIAGIALGAALAWPSELVAGFGLVGATVAPACIGLENGQLTAAGTAFAAIMFAVAAAVALRRNWQLLLAAGVAASIPQAAVMVGQAHAAEWGVVAVAAVFWLLYLVSALGLQRGLRTPNLAAFPTGLVLVSASFAGTSSVVLFDGNAEGWALLCIAAVYGAIAAALFPRAASRDLSALLAAVALALLAFGAADLLSGPMLAIAWSAEAAALSWLAQRVREIRYQLASLAYLAAALVHVVTLDSPPRQLYEASAHPASGGLALIGVAVAGGIVAFCCRPWKVVRRSDGILAPLQPTLELFGNSQPQWRSLTGWSSGAVALYGASLGILALAQESSAASIQRAFEWGQVAVAGLWAAVALAVLYAGLRRNWKEFRVAGLVVLSAALVQALLFFAPQLSGHPQAYGFLVVAAALLSGALLDRLWRADPAAFPAIAVFTLSSLGLAVAGLVLLTSSAVDGFVLLGLAGFYCLVATLVFGRDRDLATLLWAPALAVASVAFGDVVSGTWLVLAWAATAVALAVVADFSAERRLQIAAIAFLAAAGAHALVLDAPPRHFFEASRHPEHGVPTVLIVVLAAATVAHLIRARSPRKDRDRVDRVIEARQDRWRHTGIAAATILLLYAASLSILGLAEQIGAGSTAARFHGGHAAVSAVWGLLGLVALYVGLRRRLGWLQAVGFGLFAVSLAKIFLYDLTFLSSITRALSFLAVGAVLLLGGFFVQRLGVQQRGRPAA